MSVSLTNGALHAPGAILNANAIDAKHLALQSHLKDALYIKLDGEQGAWSRFKLRCQQHSSLFVSLQGMAQGQFSDNWMELFMQALPDRTFHCILRRVVLCLTPDRLSDLFNYAVRLSFTQLSNDLILPLISLMNDHEIQQMLPALQKDTKEVNEKLLSLLSECDAIRKSQDKSRADYFHQSLPFLFSWAQQFLEAFLDALNFFKPGTRIGSSWEASHRLSIYWYLLGLPALLFSAYMSVMGSIVWSAVAALVTLIGSVALLKAYLKWLRPCPDYLDICDNLTKKLMESESDVDVTLVREDFVRDVLCILSMKRPVLIYGPPGAGKSALLEVIAKTIALNKDIPACFKGAKFFLLKTSKLLREFEGVDRLERIKRTLGEQKNLGIFGWEEFSSVFEKKSVEYDCKSLFDKSVGSLPYSIVLMTDEEFKKVESDLTWVRRFEIKQLVSLDKDQTMKIMRDRVKRVCHEVSNAALEAVFEATKSKSQPDNAMKLLDQHLAVIEKHEMQTKNMMQLSKLKMERQNLLQAYRETYHLTKERKEIEDKLSSLEKGTKDLLGIEGLEKIVNGNKEELASQLSAGKKLTEDEYWKQLGEAHLLKWYNQLKRFRREQSIFMEALAHYSLKGQPQEKEQARKQFLLFYTQIMPSLRGLISRLQRHLEIPSLEESVVKRVNS